MKGITRRNFAISAFGAVCAASVSGPSALGAPDSGLLIIDPDEWIGEGILPASPGSVSSDHMDVLWEIYCAIAEHWDLPSLRSSSRAFLESNVQNNAKAELSLRSEYQQAALLYKSATSEEQARILLNRYLWEEVRGTRLAHFRRYIVKEFSTYHFLEGRFSWLGVKNVAGFSGGPIDHHPYR